MNERGQSIGIARFFLALGVGGVLYYIAERVTTPVLDRAGNTTTNATANQATMWMRDAVDLMPVLILVLAFLGGILLALWQREVVGR